MKIFVCTICGYIYEGNEAPDFCPQCKAPKEKFKEMVQAQGGDIRYVEHPEFFERDAFEGEVLAAEDGFLSGWNLYRIFGRRTSGR